MFEMVLSLVNTIVTITGIVVGIKGMKQDDNKNEHQKSNRADQS